MALAALLRFVASLSMGGEWSLESLVMEISPIDRAWLAGVIGSAANLGYMASRLPDCSPRSCRTCIRLSCRSASAYAEWLAGEKNSGCSSAADWCGSGVRHSSSVYSWRNRSLGQIKGSITWPTIDLLGVLIRATAGWTRGALGSS
jgi:hypothetical protein